MPELTTPTMPTKAPTLVTGPATNGTNAANAVNAGGATAKENVAGEGDPARPNFASALKGQVEKLAKQEAANATKGDATTGAVDALITAESAETLDQSGLPAFFSELMPLLAKTSGEAPNGEASAQAADPALAAVVAVLTPPVQGDALAAKTAKATDARDAASATLTTELPPDDTALDAQAAKLATAAAKSAEPASVEPRAITAGKDNFADALARAGEAGSRAVPAANLSPEGATHRPAAPSGEVRLSQPAGSDAWRGEVGNTLTWMASAQRQQADLVLNPPQLGRVEVSLSVSGDQASAVFASPNAAVREMLEESLPRLREILAGAGINLGEAQVGSGSRDGSAEQSAAAERSAAIARSAAPAAPAVVSNPGVVRGGIGMVDVFA